MILGWMIIHSHLSYYGVYFYSFYSLEGWAGLMGNKGPAPDDGRDDNVDLARIRNRLNCWNATTPLWWSCQNPSRLRVSETSWEMLSAPLLRLGGRTAYIQTVCNNTPTRLQKSDVSFYRTDVSLCCWGKMKKSCILVAVTSAAIVAARGFTGDAREEMEKLAACGVRISVPEVFCVDEQSTHDDYCIAKLCGLGTFWFELLG
jgi:hypothetical protein